MGTLESRIVKLEAEQQKVRFDDLTDDELRDHACAQPFKSAKQYAAIVALILRHPSTLPIIDDDPAFAEQ